jgi:hypothetical protein
MVLYLHNLTSGCKDSIHDLLFNLIECGLLSFVVFTLIAQLSPLLIEEALARFNFFPLPDVQFMIA